MFVRFELSSTPRRSEASPGTGTRVRIATRARIDDETLRMLKTWASD